MVENKLILIIFDVRKMLSLKEISKLFLCPTLRPTSKWVNATTVILCMIKRYHHTKVKTYPNRMPINLRYAETN